MDNPQDSDASRSAEASAAYWLGRAPALALRNNPSKLGVYLVLAAVFAVLVLLAIGAFLVVGIPWAWSWNFGEGPWQIILKLVAFAFTVFTVGVLLFVAVVWIFGVVGAITGLMLDRATNVNSELMRKAQSEQSLVEDELAKTDANGLVLLLRYSRIQLDQYYAIGLNQTARSFRYGVVAMWLGFLVILIGVVLSVIDLEQYGVKTKSAELVVIAGIIVEVVSALFLWLYRRSIRQLTYFYDRQMYVHGILLCYRIAESMKEPDATKQGIVKQVLERSWPAQEDDLPSAGALFGAAKPAPAAKPA